MAGCIPCFIIPLLLFIFHRYLQPILLKMWNPWEKLERKDVKFSCNCEDDGTCKKPLAETKTPTDEVTSVDGKSQKID